MSICDHDSTAIRLKLSWLFKFVSSTLQLFCFALQCVETKASGSDLHVKLPHESLLSISLTSKELKQKNKLQASQSMCGVYRFLFLWVAKVVLQKPWVLQNFRGISPVSISLVSSEVIHISQFWFSFHESHFLQD